MIKKYFGTGLGALLSLVFALLVVSCDNPTGAANDTVETQLKKERAKYAGGISFSLSEADIGKDISAQVFQLKAGQSAERSISVSIDSIDANTILSLNDEGGVIVKRIPTAAEFKSTSDELPGSATVTLKFEKDGDSVKLNVLCVVGKSGEGEARAAVERGKTFLLYGINVLSSGYISADYVIKSAPILDIDAVNAYNKNAGMVVQTPVTGSILKSASGKSVTELYQNLNVGASAAYNGVIFGGKAEAEYARNSVSQKTMFPIQNSSMQFLAYRKVNQDDTEALDFIGGYYSQDDITDQIKSGYSWVGSLDYDYVKEVTTINTTRVDVDPKSEYVYMTVHKKPYKW
jgi:hypothetical protein